MGGVASLCVAAVSARAQLVLSESPEVVWNAPSAVDPGNPGQVLLQEARLHVDTALRPGQADRASWLRRARRAYAEALHADGLNDRDRAHARRALRAIDVLLAPPPEVIANTDPVASPSPPPGHPVVGDVPKSDPRESKAETSPPPALEPPAVSVSPASIAWQRGRAALWAMHQDQTHWESPLDADNPPLQHAATALAVLALAPDKSGFEHAFDSEEQKAKWEQARAALRSVEPLGTFPAAFTVLAWSNEFSPSEAWRRLGPGMNADGRWGPATHRPADGATAFHTLAAVAALTRMDHHNAGFDSDDASERDTDTVPWRTLAAYLVLQQHPDGGWPDPWQASPATSLGTTAENQVAQLPRDVMPSDPAVSVMSRLTLEMVLPLLNDPADRAMAREAMQFGDAYLWIHLDTENNPMPGRFRAALPWALAHLHDTGYGLRVRRELRDRAQRWLLASQFEDGSWGGAAETAMAVLALRELVEEPAAYELMADVPTP